jgi:hypothetical protein
LVGAAAFVTDEGEETMDVQLSQAAVARLMRPVRGQGGFQKLLRRLQPRVHGTVLSIELADAEKLHRYSSAYGEGGFQGRTRGPAHEAQQSFNFDGEAD